MADKSSLTGYTSNQLGLMLAGLYRVPEVNRELARRRSSRAEDRGHGLSCYCCRCM